ncbi:ribose ABC transporter, partial [Mesorhizobium sp. M7A.F.Ca.US.003.02.2.1]
GHGDDLIIADTNFPSDSVARQTALGRVLRIDASAAQVVKAVLSLYPLDTFVDDSAARMEIVGKPDEIPAVQKEVQKEVDKAEGKSWPMIAVERYAFYERAKQAYCVIQTGERRFYGCFAFRKGVVPPDAE